MREGDLPEGGVFIAKPYSDWAVASALSGLIGR
jgi:hypothetical protein